MIDEQHGLFGSELIWTCEPDPETHALVSDCFHVWNSVHQGMMICGPWLEARMMHMVREWLPSGWRVSGPSQIFDRAQPGLRSRSWDIVVHREINDLFPPEAAPNSGFPLLPLEIVGAVIDTKMNFSDPRLYARQTVFNLMNDATDDQLSFLGPSIMKLVFAVSSVRSPQSMVNAAQGTGLLAFRWADMWPVQWRTPKTVSKSGY